jgi:hypothetical protein
MASAAGVAAFRASPDLGGRRSECVQCGQPDSARITGNPKVMPLDRYRETRLPSVETVITLGRLPTMAECIGDLASI